MMHAENQDELLALYRMMVRIRLCEEALVEPILTGEVKCPVHLYSGQEAVAVGVASVLHDTDYLFGNHRSHGHYLAKGGDMCAMVAEIFCRETGCARGRGGSMHLVAPERGMLGAAPIVAGTVALAVGAAMASVARDDGRVAVAFFGDGAVGEGVLHESLNFAALRKLPVLFVCENNLYSTHLPIRECRVREEIAEIAAPYGMSSVAVDGNDVLAVHRAAGELTAACRRGAGPGFIECKTYRLRGHVGPDDNIQGTHTDIRSEAEVSAWRARDPVATFRAKLNDGGVPVAALEETEKEAAAEVNDALAFARASAFPDEKGAQHYVFA